MWENRLYVYTSRPNILMTHLELQISVQSNTLWNEHAPPTNTSDCMLTIKMGWALRNVLLFQKEMSTRETTARVKWFHHLAIKHKDMLFKKYFDSFLSNISGTWGELNFIHQLLKYFFENLVLRKALAAFEHRWHVVWHFECNDIHSFLSAE